MSHCLWGPLSAQIDVPVLILVPGTAPCIADSFGRARESPDPLKRSGFTAPTKEGFFTKCKPHLSGPKIQNVRSPSDGNRNTRQSMRGKSQ